MAEYQVTVYADDSYIEDSFTGIKTRGSSLTSSISYVGRGDAVLRATEPTSCTFIKLSFPGRDAGYEKKRLQNNPPVYIYVTSRGGSGYGDLPAGSSYFYELVYNVWFNIDFRTFQKPANQSLLFSNIGQGAYLDISDLDLDYGIHGAARTTGNIYSNVDYSISASVTIHSHTGANKPYAARVYEDVKPLASNAYPRSGFVNEKTDTVLGWTFAYNKNGVVATLKQKSAKVRWRAFGASEYTEIAINGEENTCTIPAGTFSTENIEWQVVLTSDDDIEGDPSQWFKLTTIDSVSTAAPVSPVSIFVDGAVPNLFSWRHEIETGSPQTMAELQYSEDNGMTWVDLLTVSGPTQHGTVPADTMPAGTLLWRVRTYNSDDAPGEWSAHASIIVKSAPPVPVLSIATLSPRPTIQWQAVGQQAYQVQAGNLDFGMAYGSIKSYKIPAYLPDGQTTIRVRVQNSFGVWSEWAAVEAAITNAGTGSIELIADERYNGARLSWAGSTFPLYYVYRDGVPIAKTAGYEYNDQLSVGIHKYQVRGVAQDDRYVLSNEAAQAVRVKYAVIGAVAPNINWVALKCRRGSPPGHRETGQASVYYHQYDGRPLPVADVAEFRTISDDFSFTVPGPERTALAGLLGHLVVYKDAHGSLVIGILDNYDTTIQKRSDFDFTIRRVHYSEVIDYEVREGEPPTGAQTLFTAQRRNIPASGFTRGCIDPNGCTSGD